MLRPVSTHNKRIADFNTWNGLLILSGVNQNAEADNRVYKSADGNAAIWLGSIDDLWKFGKPVGVGGTWKNTDVKAGEMSDMHLITGFDKKTMLLTTDKDAEIELNIHINHYVTEPVLYKTYKVKAGETLEYKFRKVLVLTGYKLKQTRIVKRQLC